MKKIPVQKGFVILFTILISVIILMIGLGIFSIATRETVLSGTAREAQYAFYAADAGVECALYGDVKYDIFNISGNGGSFACGAISVNVIGPGTFTFDMLVDSVNKTCARVTVINNGNSRHVISQGYNICSADGKPVTTNPLLVERDLDVVYAIGEPEPGTGGAGASTEKPVGMDLFEAPVGISINGATPSSSLKPTVPGGQ